MERWLATARVFLAISALVAIWIDPVGLRYSPWAYWWLGFYIVHGVVVMLLLRMRQESTASFRLYVVHVADVIWPALISVFATGQRNPVSLIFFVFVLAAAAYRWGLWETVGTAAASVALVWIESLILQPGLVLGLDAFLLRHGLPHLGIDLVELEPQRLFMRSAYLIVMGLLLGYLAEQQKQLRAERVAIARIVGKARVDLGLTGSLQEILGEMLALFGARRALIASQEGHSYRMFLGETATGPNDAPVLHWLEAKPSDRELYLYDCPADTCYALRRSGGGDGKSFAALALDGEGSRLRLLSTAPLERLAESQPFDSIVMVCFTLGHEWSGRIFLLDASLTSHWEEELRFLQELIRQVGPAVYNVYLLLRLRRRTSAMERARFARELHDGAVQSLIGMEMQMDVLRRQSAVHSGEMTGELSRIQGLLREEVLKLRELMQQMKSLDVDSRKLLPFLADTVERFQRETGISARFISEVEEVEMPQRVCRELARIVQEGLVNVRKHSRASHVLVRLGIGEGCWKLTLEDDGCGFPFSGRHSQAELDAAGQGPVVIQERVRLLEGELTIESNPGRGARLEITIPQQREGSYG